MNPSEYDKLYNELKGDSIFTRPIEDKIFIPVYCVDNEDVENKLTIGKKYYVMAFYNDVGIFPCTRCYWIKDDTDEIFPYNENRFKLFI